MTPSPANTVTPSPLPWSVGWNGPQCRIFSDSSDKVIPVCEIYDYHSDGKMTACANAELIVRAVNSHEALIDALLEALPYVEDALDDKCFKKGAVAKSVAKIRAALSEVAPAAN